MPAPKATAAGGGTTSKATSAAVTIPSVAAAGDLLLVRFATNASTTVTVPAGWTVGQDAEAGNTSSKLVWKIATASDPGSTVTGTFGAQQRCTAYCVVMAAGDFDPAAPINAEQQSNAASGTASYTSPAVTTTKDGCTVLVWDVMQGPAGTATVTLSPPSPFVALPAFGTAFGSRNNYQGVGWKDAGTAGVEGPFTSIWSTSDNTAGGAHTVAIAPAPSTGGTTYKVATSTPVQAASHPQGRTIGAAKATVAALLSVAAAGTTTGHVAAPARVQVAIGVQARTEAATAAPAPLDVAPVAAGRTEGQAQAPLRVEAQPEAAGATVTASVAQLAAQASLQPAGATETRTAAPTPVQVLLQPQARTEAATGVALPATVRLACTATTEAATAAPLGVAGQLQAAAATEGRTAASAPVVAGIRLAAQTIVVGSAATTLPVQAGLAPTARTEGAAAAATTPVTVQVSVAASTMSATATSLPVAATLTPTASTPPPEAPGAAVTLPVGVAPAVQAHTEGRARTVIGAQVALTPHVAGVTPPSPGRIAQGALYAPEAAGTAYVATLAGQIHAGTLSGTAHTPTLEGNAVEFHRTDRKPVMWDAVVTDADPTDAVATLVVSGTSHPMTIQARTRTPGGWTVQAVSSDLFAGPDADGAGAVPLTLGAQPAVFTLTIGDTVLTDPDTITVT